jgi:hypothetical protein
VRGFPRRLVGLLQPFAEPFTHKRMGVERFSIGRVERREQPYFAESRDCVPPSLVAETNERVGQAGNRRLGAGSRRQMRLM